MTTRQTICASHFQEEHPASIQRHDGEKKRKKSKHLSTTKLSERHTCKKRSQQKKFNTTSKQRHAKETQHSIHTPACKGNATNYWTTPLIRRAASCSKCGTAQCGTAGNHCQQVRETHTMYTVMETQHCIQ